MATPLVQLRALPAAAAGRGTGMGTDRFAEHDLHRRLLDASPDIVSMIDADGSWRFVAGAAKRLLGCDPGALAGLDLHDLLHPDDAAAFGDCLAAIHARPGSTRSTEHRMRRSDGAWRWVETAGTNHRSDPVIAGIVLTTRDLTQRKLAEESVRQSEARHRALLEAVPDRLFRLRRDGLYLDVKADRVAHVVASPEFFLGRRMSEVVPSDLAEPVLAAIGRALDNRGVETLVYSLTIAGEPLDFEARIVACGEDEVLVIVRDVGERMAAQRERANAEARFRALIQHSGDMIIVLDLEGVRRFASPSTSRLLGRPDEDLVGQNALAQMPPEAAATVCTAMTTCLRDPSAHPSITLKLLHPSGSWRAIEAVATNMLDVPGVEGILFNARDVTEREANATALRESEDRFRGAFAHSGIGMSLVSLGGRFLQVNAALCALLGYPQEEMVGRHVAEFSHPLESGETLENIRRLNAGEIEGFQAERRYKRKDGGDIVALLNVSTMVDAAGLPLYRVSQMQDITERKRLEEQLRHLASHDPLTGLANRALLMERLEAALAEAARDGHEVGLLYLDLDGFKAINDTLGHAAGDRLLTCVGQAIAGRLRPGDVAARIGGDEFVVLLERVTRPGQADELAQELMDTVAAAPDFGASEATVACCVGVALGGPAQSASGLLRAADAALYRAKAARWSPGAAPSALDRRRRP